MVIFIRKIPETASQKDLGEFIAAGLRRTGFLRLFRKRQTQDCDILRIKDLDKDLVEYHGLAYIKDKRLAASLVKNLNGSKLKGKRVEVRRYYQRSPDRERRTRLSSPENLAIVDRRQGERRRDHLMIETLSGTRPAVLGK